MFGRSAGAGALLVGLASGFAFGSDVALAQPAASTQPTAAASVAPQVTIGQDPASRFYGGLEYLHWWVKGAPLSVPLLTTAPDVQPFEGGFIRGPEVSILYGSPYAPATGGNNTQTFPGLSGGRLTLGYWLDDGQHYAIEGEGFGLQNGTATFQAYSQANGTPPMRIPVYNSVPYFAGGPGGMIVPPVEDGVPVSVPDAVSGSVSFKNTLSLWGLQANGVVNLYRDSSWELSGLGGFRYMNLSEGFNLFLSIGGVPNTAYSTEHGWATDQFSTQNNFYGATLGLRGKYKFGPMFVEASGRVSFGADNESLDVFGYFQEFNTPVVSGVPGVAFGQRALTEGPNGIFAQPSNEGQTSGSRFAVVPEISIKLGYNLTPSTELTIGYDFLFISSVLRPTDQIDRSFSKGLPFLQDPTSTVGPVRFFRTSNFYAQGLTVGVSYRF